MKLLNYNAYQYYEKAFTLTQFKRPKKKLIINHSTDHRYLNRLLPFMANVFDLKVKFNLNLYSWSDKVYGNERKKGSSNPFKVMAFFLSEYDIKGFSLNFQLILKHFDFKLA